MFLVGRRLYIDGKLVGLLDNSTAYYSSAGQRLQVRLQAQGCALPWRGHPAVGGSATACGGATLLAFAYKCKVSRRPRFKRSGSPCHAAWSALLPAHLLTPLCATLPACAMHADHWRRADAADGQRGALLARGRQLPAPL